MLAFSLPSLFPYFILCLGAKHNKLLQYSISNSSVDPRKKFSYRNCLQQTVWATAQRHHRQVKFSKIMHWSSTRYVWSLSHTLFKLHFTRSTEYVWYLPTHLILVHDHYHLAFAFSLARSARDTTVYIWLRVAFVCSIPHRARRPAYYLVICMICH